MGPTASDIATALCTFLEEVDRRGTVDQIVLYSDSPAGQNRNQFVSGMIIHFLSRAHNVKQITHKVSRYMV